MTNKQYVCAFFEKIKTVRPPAAGLYVLVDTGALDDVLINHFVHTIRQFIKRSSMLRNGYNRPHTLAIVSSLYEEESNLVSGVAQRELSILLETM